MYLITIRVVKTSKKPSLDQLGKTPSDKGPNELRIGKVTRKGSKFELELLTDELSKAEAGKLSKTHSLDLDLSKTHYAGLKVACEIMRKARNQGKDILLYCHGYNNDVEDVVKTGYELAQRYSVVPIVFTWPANGGGAISGTTAYLSDKRDARASTDALSRVFERIQSYHKLLTEKRRDALWDKAAKKYELDGDACRSYFSKLLDQECKTTVNFVAHSMGGYLTKHAVLPSASEARKLVFDNIALVGADANNEHHSRWVELLQPRKRLYVVINENDYALKWARRKPGEEQLARLGHSLKSLNAPNAHYIDVTKAKAVLSEHSYFVGKAVKNNPKLLKLFGDIFTGKSVEGRLDYRADINAYRLK
jgi:esterase/lipase superfamily enzyme